VVLGSLLVRGVWPPPASRLEKGAASSLHHTATPLQPGTRNIEDESWVVKFFPQNPCSLRRKDLG